MERRFDNTPSGHDRLIGWLRKEGALVQITIEASGIYSLDLALALHACTSRLHFMRLAASS